MKHYHIERVWDALYRLSCFHGFIIKIIVPRRAWFLHWEHLSYLPFSYWHMMHLFCAINLILALLTLGLLSCTNILINIISSSISGTSLAAKFLRANGITLFKVREETVNLLGKSDMYFFSPEHPPLTEPAQRALDWAVDEKLKSGIPLVQFSH